MNPNADKITGGICGVRVEDIEDLFMKKVLQLDKLVDTCVDRSTFSAFRPSFPPVENLCAGLIPFMKHN